MQRRINSKRLLRTPLTKMIPYMYFPMTKNLMMITNLSKRKKKATQQLSIARSVSSQQVETIYLSIPRLAKRLNGGWLGGVGRHSQKLVCQQLVCVCVSTPVSKVPSQAFSHMSGLHGLPASSTMHQSSSIIVLLGWLSVKSSGLWTSTLL